MRKIRLIFVIVPTCILSVILVIVIFNIFFEKNDVAQDENWRDTELFHFLGEKSKEYGYSDFGINFPDHTYKKEVIIIIDHEIDEVKFVE